MGPGPGLGPGVARAGWLLKKAESSWGWRRRWFVLQSGGLTYQVGTCVGRHAHVHSRGGSARARTHRTR